MFTFFMILCINSQGTKPEGQDTHHPEDNTCERRRRARGEDGMQVCLYNSISLKNQSKYDKMLMLD